jgi:predicted TIM-barrel fold metal-dependent hydrolase
VVRNLSAAAFLLLAACVAQGQTPPAEALAPDPAAVRAAYDRLLPAIQAIPIFDNHSHPGYADDADVDAMAAPPGMSTSLRLRGDNPELIAASRELFAYPYNDATPEHLKWLIDRKAELRRSTAGTGYFDRILDKLNIETALANRPVMAPYLNARRFRWVFFTDSVLFPFNNSALIARNTDQATYIPLQEAKLKRELAHAQLQQLPATFDEYLAFVTRLLEENKAHGGVAIKFEISYFRPLRFGDPTHEQAEALYARYRSGAVPQTADYLTFQDYVFRHLLREAGRLSLPVHLHTAVGIGDFFSLSDDNVLQLEGILRDPRYDRTTFVLLHGGYPFHDQAIWLAARRNVYLDTSLMELYLYPDEFKRVLRRWLLLFPDKVVFGSDAFPFNDAVGAEESYWLGVRSARIALTAALSEMVAAHELTEERALAFAHAYLHDTAQNLYR